MVFEILRNYRKKPENAGAIAFSCRKVCICQKKVLSLRRKAQKKGYNMSAAQAIASQQFLEAMGTMVNEEQNVSRVVKFINWMKKEDCSTISEEEYAKLIPAETMFDDLRQMVHGFYQTKQLA